jgi:Smg protein
MSDLATDLGQEKSTQKSMRVFSSEECIVLDLDARNCLIKLENMGILSPVTRERVIEQVIGLRKMGLENSLVKWVAYLVLCSHPEQAVALDRLELFVADTFLGGMQ